VAHGLGKLIFAVRVLELIMSGIFFLNKNGGVYDFEEEDSNGHMGSLCKKLKKKLQEVLGGKKEDQGAFWVVSGDGGVLLVFWRVAWRVADFFRCAWSC
jgi:hypothetical protein